MHRPSSSSAAATAASAADSPPPSAVADHDAMIIKNAMKEAKKFIQLICTKFVSGEELHSMRPDDKPVSIKEASICREEQYNLFKVILQSLKTQKRTSPIEESLCCILYSLLTAYEFRMGSCEDFSAVGILFLYHYLLTHQSKPYFLSAVSTYFGPHEMDHHWILISELELKPMVMYPLEQIGDAELFDLFKNVSGRVADKADFFEQERNENVCGDITAGKTIVSPSLKPSVRATYTIQSDDPKIAGLLKQCWNTMLPLYMGLKRDYIEPIPNMRPDLDILGHYGDIMARVYNEHHGDPAVPAAAALPDVLPETGTGEVTKRYRMACYISSIFPPIQKFQLTRLPHQREIATMIENMCNKGRYTGPK